METFINWALLAMLAAAFAFALSVLFTFPVMWLWNALLPELFGFKVITFWQAFGLILLVQLLAPKSSSSSSSK